MPKLNIEMPLVKKCDVQDCGYNTNCNCHAKAITIGDFSNPGCDTYLNIKGHTAETKNIAGVGACKVSACKYNNDYECTAENISVGFSSANINCLTYSS
ncbi:MAG: DUF1540 domain-containing protein [Bacteriovoracaceae bacterium]|nr:DUF1540 domain-containing protein [Bacteriovoracaceae bacterium]